MAQHYYPVLTQQELEDAQRLLPAEPMRQLIQTFVEAQNMYDVPTLGRLPVSPYECGYNDLSVDDNALHLIEHLEGVTHILDQIVKCLEDGERACSLQPRTADPYEDIIHAAGRLLIFAKHLQDTHQRHAEYNHTEVTHNG